jgi:hypothetical protein
VIRVFRFEVPVDDQWHEVRVNTDPVHVAARKADVVEFWALVTENAPQIARRFRVFGTGHPIPRGCWHRGTAIAAGGALVWHLLEDVEQFR